MNEITKIIESMAARAADGEMTEFLAGGLEKIKAIVAAHPHKRGYLDRIREVEMNWRVSAWHPPVEYEIDWIE